MSLISGKQLALFYTLLLFVPAPIIFVFSVFIPEFELINTSVSWRRDYKKVAGIFTLEIKNLLGNPSGYNWTYNYKAKEIEKQSVVVVMPNISYRIEF